MICKGLVAADIRHSARQRTHRLTLLISSLRRPKLSFGSQTPRTNAYADSSGKRLRTLLVFLLSCRLFSSPPSSPPPPALRQCRGASHGSDWLQGTPFAIPGLQTLSRCFLVRYIFISPYSPQYTLLILNPQYIGPGVDKGCSRFLPVAADQRLERLAQLGVGLRGVQMAYRKIISTSIAEIAQGAGFGENGN